MAKFVEIVPYEEYRLTLNHDLVNSDGTIIQMEEPLSVKHLIVIDAPPEYRDVIINAMMDRMKRFVLKGDPRNDSNDCIQ